MATTWTTQEDQLLWKAIEKYGIRRWDKVSASLLFHKRSIAQCKERYHFLIEPKVALPGSLLPSVVSGESIFSLIWTQSEDEKLINLVKVYDPLWTTIGALMGRPPKSCHSRFHLASGSKAPKMIGDLKGSKCMSNKRKAGEMGEYVFLPGETEKTVQAGTSATTKAAKVKKAHPTLGKKPKMEKNTACMKTKVQLD